MKNMAKKIISLAIQNDFMWSILNATIIRFSFFARCERNEYLMRTAENYVSTRSFIQQEVLSLSPDLVVMHGPFKGMQYPQVKALGSSISPKILGSYERELHDVIEQICSTNYTEIVDIGCAEGYYAVGLAMRIPTAQIFAYDTNNEAVHLCKTMATLNGIDKRLTTGSFCDANTLRSIPLTEKMLIISDCEGCEKDLFSDDLITLFRQHDFLIEIHDFIDIEISSLIFSRFSETHSIKRVQSIDDITKVQNYQYNEIVKYSLADRKRLLAENRPSIMEWFFMTPL